MVVSRLFGELFPMERILFSSAEAEDASGALHEYNDAWRQLNDVEVEDDEDDGSEPNTVATALSYIFLFGLIFGLSATVEIKNLKKQLQNKFAIATGVCMQFLIMPTLGFLAVVALNNQDGWTRSMGVALLVVTSSPGGSYSNWWCSMFNADLALSVAMTTVSSLLSMFMLPLNLFFYTFLAYGRSEEESVVQALDFGTIFLALGIVLLAIASGLYAGYRFDTRSFHVLANRMGSVSGILLVLFSVFLSSGADGAENNFWNQEWSFYVGVAFPCLVGISLANIIARSLRLANPETVAIAIECCYQNTGIATSVAIAMYDDKEERAQAVAVPLFYGVVEAVAIGIYCVWAWKVGWTKAPKNENFCVMLTTTYEGADDEDSQPGRSGSDDDLASDETQTRFADEEEAVTVAGTATLASSSNDSAERAPFWKRWLGFGGGRKGRSDSMELLAQNQDHATAAASRKTKAATTLPPLAASGSTSSKQALDTLTGTAAAPSRDRSFTVETSTSSGPPTTPSGRREVALTDSEQSSSPRSKTSPVHSNLSLTPDSISPPPLQQQRPQASPPVLPSPPPPPSTVEIQSPGLSSIS